MTFGKEEKLLSLFVHDMIVYQKKTSRESTKKLIIEQDRGWEDGRYQSKYTSKFQLKNIKRKKRQDVPEWSEKNDSGLPKAQE
jgi:hypothetical protein